MRTALIERPHWGGTCVNDGCMPTKTLVASARPADMQAIKARKDRIVQQAVANLTGWLQGIAHLTLLWTHARFVAPHAVDVGGRVITAPKVFINVGGRPTAPDRPGLDGVPFLNSTSVMDLDVLPEHLLVAGGSYIGLEFAQIFRRFGSRVTVMEAADRLIAREDVELSREVQMILEREGVEFITGVGAARVSPDMRGVRCRCRPAARRTRSKAATCWWPPAGGRTPTTSVSNSPASRSTPAASSASTTSCAPTYRACGRWAT